VFYADDGFTPYLVAVPIRLLREVRLGELPRDFKVLPVRSMPRGGVASPLFPGRVLVSGDGSLTYEYWVVPKYYRGFIPVESYVFDVVVRVAEQAGFRLLEGMIDEDCVWALMEAWVSRSLRVGEALSMTVGRLLRALKRFERSYSSSARRLMARRLCKLLASLP